VSKVRPISGFPEWLPSERIIEQHFLDVIRETFELHGFASIATQVGGACRAPCSQGEDTDKEIYAISRLAGARTSLTGVTRATAGPALRPDGAVRASMSWRTPAS
jgi:histidyl-tRNA synthetase